MNQVPAISPASNAATSSIVVRDRHRRDLGDLNPLAESIRAVGLLHPVVVDLNNVLIAGERRLEACKLLGWDSIPVTVAPLDDIVKGEFAENAIRKDFLPSEVDAIRRALEPKVATPVGRPAKKKVETFHNKTDGKTRDKIGAFAGVSGRTVEKIAAVVEAAEEEPEKFAPLVDEMDRTGKVDGAYKKLKKAKRKQDVADLATTLGASCPQYDLYNEPCTNALKGDANSVDWVITDPPYPKEFLPVYDDLGRVAAHALKPGGSLLCMVGQSYLPEVIGTLSKHLTYHWTIAYLTPGGQAVQIFPRRINTFWKPVLWFLKGEFEGDWIGDVTRSNTNDNDKRFHHWGQSESGMADLMGRFIKPKDKVLDPFMGAGTTGAIALHLGAQFFGFDSDEDSFNETLVRLDRATLEQ